jgi:DNA polymerase III epsilon subunit-like protein
MSYKFDFEDPKKYQVMIDIETLSTRNNAAIMSIGAVKFNIESGVIDTYYQNIDASTAKKYNRHIDKETIGWWSKQNPAALKALLVDVKQFDQVIPEFVEWYGVSTPTWGNSAQFDLGIIESACLELSMPIPWKYWHCYCYKTVTHLFGVNNADVRRAESGENQWHNALDDAISQTNTLVRILRGS